VVTERQSTHMQTRFLRKLLTGILVLLGTLSISHAAMNLIVNGSFEEPTAFGPGQWTLYNSIPGWTPVNGQQIEIGYGGVYGVSGYDGNNVMEMDSRGNVVVDQIVGTAGGSYVLSFLYAQRAGVSPTSGSFEVWWNGSFLASFAPTTTAMALYSTTVTGALLNTLEFRGTGTSDSYGAILDDVQLFAAVPEPSSIVAGALLLLPFGASTIKILRRKRVA